VSYLTNEVGDVDRRKPLVALADIRVGNTAGMCQVGKMGVSRPWRRWALAAALGLSSACSPPARPSFLLVVLDTTRADAVSAYGVVENTTPTFDALAREGLLYERAYANANWTLPSHASLFTGLRPSQHGLRVGGNTLGEVPTVAGLLAAAGYDTAGFSQNPWLGRKAGVTKGFARFTRARAQLNENLHAWAKARHDDRPFFLFVNVMDAHAPYRVRDRNPFLPPGVDTARAKATAPIGKRKLCTTRAGDPELAILHGLYLGNVRAADARLRDILEIVRGARAPGPLIVIVTSDHGEYFGEHGLLRHHIGVWEPVLRIPLLVHGAPGKAPARITTPVQLVDLAPSILGWAGVTLPDRLAGSPLPVSDASGSPDRAVVGEFYDFASDAATSLPPELLNSLQKERAECQPEDRARGNMRTLVRFPYKLVWYERYAPQLFDLTTDPAETVDLAPRMPERVRAMVRELSATDDWEPVPRASQMLDRNEIKQLQALGYLGGSTDDMEATSAGD